MDDQFGAKVGGGWGILRNGGWGERLIHLYRLWLTKKDKSFERTTKQETAFQQLKETLHNAPVMAF